VLNENGQLIGLNTDGSGFLMSLERDKKFNPKNHHVLILGAGGAARAIATILLLNKVRSLVIANRSPNRAKKLVRDLRSHFKGKKISWCRLEGKIFEKYLRQTELLVNATSVGLKETHFTDFPWSVLRPNTLVSDIVYAPRPVTPFLLAAKKNKNTIHTGDGMLIYQGALSLEMWTGKKPNISLMRQVLLKRIRKK
jgi:shikimate dehydrogenase